MKMSSLFRVGFVSLFAGAAFVSRGDVALTPAYAEPKLEISLAENEEITIADWLTREGKSLDGCATLVKKGAGKLRSTAALDYNGDIVVENGVLSATVTGALGGKDGIVYVLNGATMEFDNTANAATGDFNFSTKTFVVNGSGFGATGSETADVGALHRLATTTWLQNMLGTVYLNSDALIALDGGNTDIKIQGTFYLNGHTFKMRHGGQYKLWQMTGAKMYGPGTVDVVNGTFFPEGTTMSNLDPNEDFILNIRKNRNIRFWGGTGENTACRLVLQDGSEVSACPSAGDQTSTCLWYGPVTLLGNTRMSVYSSAKEDSASFKGVVSGDGSFNAGSGPLHLKLFNGGNDFTGGICRSQGSVDLYADGAAPRNGGAITLTNALLRLYADDKWSLPPLTAIGAVGVRTVGGGVYCDATETSAAAWAYGSFRDAVVKDGDGELTYDSVYGAPLLDVKRGSVKFAYNRKMYGPAGLYAGFHVCTGSDFTNARANETSYYADDTSWRRTDLPSGSTLDLSFFKPHVALDIEILRKSPSNGSGWGQFWNSSMCTYKGYIWNRSDQDVTWSFAAQVEKQSQLKIDGNIVFSTSDYNTPGYGTVRLTPGAHRFYYSVFTGNGWMGKAGGDTTHPWDSAFAICVDKQGRGIQVSTDTSVSTSERIKVLAQNYEVLKDDGSGELFTLTDDESLVPAKAPAFDQMRFAKGTSLELNGDYVASNVTGYAAITGGDFTINGAYAVDGEMEPGKMTVDGTLTFGPESTFEVANAAALEARKGDLGKAYVLAEATEIVGCPAIGDSAKEARWEVSVSGDHKQLLLSRTWKGTVLIFR